MKIDRLTGRQLEELTRTLLEAEGFQLSSEQAGEVDILAIDPSGRRTVVECKATQLRGALRHAVYRLVAHQKLNRAHGALLVAPAEISTELRDQAEKGLGVQIWGRADLLHLIHKYPAQTNALSAQWAPEIKQASGGVRLRALTARGFRGLTKFSFVAHADDDVVVLVGANGAGKTSVLTAIAIGFSWFVKRIASDSANGFPLKDFDITNGQDEATIEVEATVGGRDVNWTVAGTRRGRKRTEKSNLGEVTEAARAIQASLAENPQAAVPLVLYYPVNRLVVDIPRRTRGSARFDQLSALEDSLGGGEREFRRFFEWFRQRESLENEKRIREKAHFDPQLKAVRTAVRRLLPGYASPQIERNPLRMTLAKGRKRLAVDQLSDGEKCLLAIGGDMARRFAMTNPALANPLEASALVMIDEVELHLHPAWQRNIVPAFRATFPHAQFILTTHSPQVVGAVEATSLLMMTIVDGDVVGRRVDAAHGWDSNRILEVLMGVPERPQSVKDKLDSYLELIDRGKLEEAATLRRTLEEEIGSDEPLLKRADVLLRRKRLTRE